ncbi:hypothetical protein SAMN05421810_103537 [Amycolatopsis arida]|uniref:Uncharacterized protein n=1 Tax=Amycolatopsis arida TaxID=587909 RepID=A0A1I5TI84_9PSEU|nr:hypothetical protein [Amycolatopsis arida]TDX96085.1 hypothetical protein CLV69_103220 [Amycolatopsis arida]SFP82735.1 hypothetical protein SAMN05421810_103537 [Amycolatopsis arida]
MRVVVLVGALAVVLSGCGGEEAPRASGPPSMPPPSTQRPVGELDRLPNLASVLTADRVTELLGGPARPLSSPRSTPHSLRLAVCNPDFTATLTLSADAVRSAGGSSVDLAGRMFRDGLIPPERFRAVSVRGADEAALKLEEGAVRVTTRTGNVLIDLRHVGDAPAEALRDRVVRLATDLVALLPRS